MPYILQPGARLLVGPHGQLDESLGSACCSSCERGGPCRGALAGPGAEFLSAITKPATALNTMATAAAAAGKPMPIFYAPPPADDLMISASPGIASGSSSKTMLVVAAALGLGVFILSRKRGRRR